MLVRLCLAFAIFRGESTYIHTSHDPIASFLFVALYTIPALSFLFRRCKPYFLFFERSFRFRFQFVFVCSTPPTFSPIPFGLLTVSRLP